MDRLHPLTIPLTPRSTASTPRSIDSTFEEQSLSQPLLPHELHITLWQALKDILSLAFPFALSHGFNLLGPIIQGIYLGNGTPTQREAFGLIETFLNSIITAANATQIAIQMHVASTDGLSKRIQADLEKIIENLRSQLQDYPDYQNKLNQLLTKLKSSNHSNTADKYPDDKNDSLASALSFTKKQLEEVLPTRKVKPEHCDIWDSLLDDLQNDRASKDTQFFITRLEETHQQIVEASNHHVGLNIRAGMLYAQTLLIIILPLILSLKPLLLNSGIEPDVAQEVNDFFTNLAWGSPALVGMLANRETFNALQKKWLASFLGGFNAIANAGIGAIVFYGWPALNIPSFGTAGIAATFSTNAWLTFLIGIIVLRKNSFFKKFNLFSTQGGNFWNQFKQITRDGLQVFGMALPDYALLTILMVLVSGQAAKLGIPADVAQGAFAMFNLIVYIIYLGLADASVNLVSRAISALNPQHLMAYIKAGVVMQGITGLTAAGLLWSIPDQLFNVFCLSETCDADEIEQFRAITSYGAIGVIFDALIIGIKSCLAGIGDLTPSMFISMVSLLGLGMALQFGVGLPNNLTPAQLNLLRVLALTPSLIGHAIRGFDQFKEAAQVLAQAAKQKEQGPQGTYDTLSSPQESKVDIIFYDSDDDDESRTCLSRVRRCFKDASLSGAINQASRVLGFFGSRFSERHPIETTAPETQSASFSTLNI